ncbi:hypothetical protein VTO42DRAFT_8394 [Malbranchea cinnamomea]
MSEPSENNGHSSAGPGLDLSTADIPEALPSPALAQLTRDILDDIFYNIIYDIVSKVHREEKVARGLSAAILVRSLAENQTGTSEGSSEKENGAVENGNVVDNQTGTKPVKAETEGAIYEDGKVYLKGNPLDTTDEIICPDCRLPRLLYPVIGEGSRPVPDPNKEYCRKRPPVRLEKRDVHGRPYAIEKATKKKKTAAPASPNPSPPSSPSTPHTGVPGSSSSLLGQLPGKSYVPSVKCPNCPRYFFLTRIAQHLDRCLGLSARQASRNRTPMDSSFSTPAPTTAATTASTTTSSQSATGTAAPGAVARKRPGEEEGGKSVGTGVGAVKKKKKPPVGPSKLKSAASVNSSSSSSTPAGKTAKE